jgi:hypothetical protein
MPIRSRTRADAMLSGSHVAQTRKISGCASAQLTTDVSASVMSPCRHQRCASAYPRSTAFPRTRISRSPANSPESLSHRDQGKAEPSAQACSHRRKELSRFVDATMRSPRHVPCDRRVAGVVLEHSRSVTHGRGSCLEPAGLPRTFRFNHHWIRFRLTALPLSGAVPDAAE